MTQIILEQRTRGCHGFVREIWVVGEGLKEGLELEMGSEGVRWPLGSQLLQSVSDDLGGHRDSCLVSGDQRSLKLMQNGDSTGFA